MRPALIFCPNHTAILPTLEVVSAAPQRPTIVVVSRRPIKTLLRKISFPNTVKLLFIPAINNTVASFSPRAILAQRRAYQQTYHHHFLKLTKYDIYFFNHVFWDFGLKLIQDLSTNNHIYFWNLFKLKQLTDRLLVCELFLRILFGLRHVAVFRNLGLPCPVITDDFIWGHGLRQVIPKADFNLVRRYRKSLVPTRNEYKVIILPSGDYAVPEVDRNGYEASYQRLLTMLSQRYKPEEILVKPHPGIVESVPCLEPHIHRTLNDIPAELLLSPRTELLLSTKATTLEFNRPYLKRLRRISLLYLFYPPSKQRRIFASMLEAMTTPIAFPRSHAKLRQLLTRT